jgi:DNA repair protein RecO (recombination protein O)
MEWNDDAIVLSSRAHGENGVILELLTRDHGRHAGLVRGGASRRVKPTLQPEAHAPVFLGGEILLDAMVAYDANHWLPLYVRWEAGLLEALGFGLDLSECAATGAKDDLTYVSPKTGRAVSRDGAGIYANRLFRLPLFLLDAGAEEPQKDEIAAGLALTGHFLLERVLRPHGKEMPKARLRLDALADSQIR